MSQPLPGGRHTSRDEHHQQWDSVLSGNFIFPSLKFKPLDVQTTVNCSPKTWKTLQEDWLLITP
eukprot:5636012-Amphidinium_carterae.1